MLFELLLYLYCDIFIVLSVDYCAVNVDHILCNAGKPKKFNESVYYYPKTDAQREELLNEINKIRNEIAGGEFKRRDKTLPPASAMLQLQWSEELEMAAWNVAGECVVNQSRALQQCCHCMNTGKMFIKGFANEGGTSVRGDPPVLVLGSLTYVLRENFRDINLKCLQDSGMSDCPPMDTIYFMGVDVITHVACIFVHCRSNQQKNNVACYFGGLPSALMVYKQGKSCSRCPRNSVCSTNYSNLCECESSKYCIWKSPDLNESCELGTEIEFIYNKILIHNGYSITDQTPQLEKPVTQTQKEIDLRQEEVIQELQTEEPKQAQTEKSLNKKGIPADLQTEKEVTQAKKEIKQTEKEVETGLRQAKIEMKQANIEDPLTNKEEKAEEIPAYSKDKRIDAPPVEIRPDSSDNIDQIIENDGEQQNHHLENYIFFLDTPKKKRVNLLNSFKRAVGVISGILPTTCISFNFYYFVPGLLLTIKYIL